jgi:hypothetical protein
MSTKARIAKCRCGKTTVSRAKDPRCITCIAKYYKNMQKTCVIDNCKTGVKSRNMCEMHYARWCKHGSPYLTKIKIRYIQQKNGIIV